jgi:two-component system response regulator
MGRTAGSQRAAPVSGKVLIVEDDAVVRNAMVAVAESTGVAVLQAEDGAEAIARLRSGGVALVVLDLGLPGISGLRVLEWMSQNSQEVPVLVVTGLEDPPNVLNRFPNLVRIMEKKPVSVDLLRHLIETYLDGS